MKKQLKQAAATVLASMSILLTACGGNQYPPMMMQPGFNQPGFGQPAFGQPGMNPIMQPPVTMDPMNQPTGTVMGQVVDSLTGAGVGGVQVEVTGVRPARNATTDASGYFTLSGVPQGRQTLTVRRNDYATAPGNNQILVEVKAGTSVQMPNKIEIMPFRASAVNGFIRAFNSFTQPKGIALSPDSGDLYVVDVIGAGGLISYDHGEVKRLNGEGGIVAAFGAPLSAGSKLFSVDMFRLLRRPNGVGVDQGGNVFVANTGQNNVRRYGSGGQWINNIELNFKEVFDIATMTTGDAVISDPGTGRLILLDSSMNVRVPNMLPIPTNGVRGVATNNNDDIFVVNAAAAPGQVVMKFDRYGNRMPLSFGRIGGVQPGHFSNPTDLAIDNRNGDIYVVDSGNNRVQRFDSEGNYLSEFGSFGTENGQFNAPWGVAVDKDGFVYVTDSKNARVQKFASGRVMQERTNTDTF